MSHGLIELEVAQAMGFEHDLYPTADGVMVAIISPDNFTSYKNQINAIDNFYYLDEDINVSCVEVLSTIEGIHIYLSPYNLDDNVIDSLTDGDVKLNETYLAIRNMGDMPRNRIDIDEFITSLNTYHNPDNDDAPVIIPPAPEEAPAPAIPIEDIIVGKLTDCYGVVVADEKTTYTGNNMNVVEFVDERMKMLAKRTKKLIVISSDGSLVGHVLSSIIQERELKDHIIQIVNAPSQYRGSDEAIMFGHNIKCNGISSNFKSSKTFTDAATNKIYASLEGYVLTDYAYLFRNTNNENKTETAFDLMLKRWDDNMDYTSQYKEDVEYAKRFNENICESVSRFISENKSDYMVELENNHQKAVNEIESSQAKLSIALKNKADIDQILFSYNANSQTKTIYKEVRKDMDGLFQLPQIKSIFLNERSLNVNTNEINVLDSRTGDYHNIGTFEIRIKLSVDRYSESSTVNIINTKYQIKAFSDGVMQAPHVFRDGHLCHGNIINSVMEYYSQMNIYNLVFSLIMFLESANVDDPAGAQVNKWPVVSKEEIEKQVEEAKASKEFRMVAEGSDTSDEVESEFIDAMNVTVTLKEGK